MEAISARNSGVARELLLLLLLATLWGGSYTFIKLGVATIPPVTLIAGRTAIAGLLLLLIMRWRGVRLPADAATWRRFMFQACLNSVVPWTLVAWAERSVDAGLATILNSTSPIFTFFLTLAVAHQEAASPRKLFGVAVGMAGICLIVGVQAFESLGQALLAQLAIVARRRSVTRVPPCSAAASRGSIQWRPRLAHSFAERRSSFPRASWNVPGRFRRPPLRCWRYSGLRYFPPRLPS